MHKHLPYTFRPDIMNVDDLKHFIIKNGIYSAEENERIFIKWFKDAPRYLFSVVNSRYRITDTVMCDVGCSYGMNLIFAAPGSYGIEISEYSADFARSIGLRVVKRNVYDDLGDLDTVNSVWCSAVLEHVDSTHVFLRKLHGLLKDGGRVFIYVPTIPLFPGLVHIPFLRRYMTGRLHGDHVNAFTAETLQFICERAGFRTIEVSPFYPCPLSVFNGVPLINRLIDGCVYVGEKNINWEYPDNSTRK